jgi:uncharacterized membrane protein HdeD (DUF308 family)
MSAPPVNNPTDWPLTQASLRHHWKLYLAEGILLIVLGLAAVVVPPVAGIAATVFIGWMLIIAGVVGLVSTFRAKSAPGVVWSVLSAAIAIVAGGLLVWFPLTGLVTLTLVLIGYLLADGVVTIVFSLNHRREASGRWGWMLINGIVDLILAAIIYMALPQAFAWAVGLIVGFDLVFGGTTLVVMALAAREAA